MNLLSPLTIPQWYLRLRQKNLGHRGLKPINHRSLLQSWAGLRNNHLNPLSAYDWRNLHQLCPPVSFVHQWIMSAVLVFQTFFSPAKWFRVKFKIISRWLIVTFANWWCYNKNIEPNYFVCGKQKPFVREFLTLMIKKEQEPNSTLVYSLSIKDIDSQII